MAQENKLTFKCENLTCCSLEFHWSYGDKNPKNIYTYKLYLKEGGDHYITNYLYFTPIYEGYETNYESINLKPNQEYTFKLEVTKDSQVIKYETMTVKTLISPNYIISEKSIKIANGEKLENETDLNDDKIKILKICNKLIFSKPKKNENIFAGNYGGIKIKIAYEPETKIYYISFDIKSKNYSDFIKDYIKERGNNLLIPCHFIIQKLPTIFILNLLKKYPVILTGKRFGGMIASSLAFYILYIGKKIGKNYNNVFNKREKGSLGVVTFGSPSFLSNLTGAVKMKEKASYFSHIKHEFDFIPEIIDFISATDDENLLKNLNNKEFNENFKVNLKIFLEQKKCTKENIKNNINNFPFGHYYEIKNTSVSEISFINENTFDNFYYYKIFDSSLKQSNLNVYQNLYDFNTNFNKEPLEFLKNKNYELDSIRIIRRILSNGTTKGIIKFKLILPKDDNITPDIIKNIDLKAFNGKEYSINCNDIYYDNEIDITAYQNDLNDNIKDVIIINIFGGEIKAKHILNIKGSGETGEMLKNNLEKLFLFPFFKLFEIFYISGNDEDKYKTLKKENFGDDFNSLKIIQPFEKQIKTLDDLLFLTRPDLIGKYKNEYFIELIKKYDEDKKDKENNEENKEQKENKENKDKEDKKENKDKEDKKENKDKKENNGKKDKEDKEDMKKNNDKKDKCENKDKEDNKEEKENKDKEENEAKERLIKEQMERLKNIFKKYYEKAKLLQKNLNFNCIESEPNSIAKENSFPENIKDNCNIKKLFMCKCSYKEFDDFTTEKSDNSYIKEFFIENLINKALKEIEEVILKEIKHIKDNDKYKDYKEYLNYNIGRFYDYFLMPNVYFVLILILTSIESGDNIKFNHYFNWYKAGHLKGWMKSWSLYINFSKSQGNLEKDFTKILQKNKSEEINMNNLFCKRKIKNIIKFDDYEESYKLSSSSKYDNDSNKNTVFEFSKFSENNKMGKEYYKNFLEILNNYSNDFIEDIEISIFDNLKEENPQGKDNLSTLKEMINDLINDEESKKGFLALVKQSFLFGKLRSYLVSIFN